jgi:very-short-patch-repair endonuclease
MPTRKRTSSTRKKAAAKRWQQRPRTVRDEIKRLRAADMRRRPTKAEAHLWKALEATRRDLYMTRQKLLHGWIADIYCPAARCLIEVDGPSHAGRRGADALRDRVLAGHGYLTLRYTNEQVLGQTATVVAHARKYLFARLGRS